MPCRNVPSRLGCSAPSRRPTAPCPCPAPSPRAVRDRSSRHAPHAPSRSSTPGPARRSPTATPDLVQPGPQGDGRPRRRVGRASLLGPEGHQQRHHGQPHTPPRQRTHPTHRPLHIAPEQQKQPMRQVVHLITQAAAPICKRDVKARTRSRVKTCRAPLPTCGRSHRLAALHSPFRHPDVIDMGSHTHDRRPCGRPSRTPHLYEESAWPYTSWTATPSTRRASANRSAPTMALLL